MSTKISLIAMLTSFALAGCAQTSGDVNNAQAANTAPAVAAPAPAPAPVAAPTVLTSAPSANATIADDGTVAEFDAKSTELSDDALHVIARLIDSAKQAHSIDIIGYCDKQDAGKNAKQLARARATAVRNELAKHGVSSKKLHVKYVITESRHAVVVLLK
jgi:outer membrane protein OmpA-like peptidoglycan-associated protein